MFCRHVFGNISCGFRGISRFFGNFAGFRGNTWISRVRNRAKYQKPWTVQVLQSYISVLSLQCEQLKSELLKSKHDNIVAQLKQQVLKTTERQMTVFSFVISSYQDQLKNEKDAKSTIRDSRSDQKTFNIQLTTVYTPYFKKRIMLWFYFSLFCGMLIDRFHCHATRK